MEKWRILKQKEILSSKVIKLMQVEAVSPDGAKHGHFDKALCADWVNILALTPDNQVIIIRQYRVGTDAVTIEIPGGAIHSGEDPLLAAQRELAEESGVVAKEWMLLGSSEVNPAFMNNRSYYYLASGAQRTQKQNLDPLEVIDVDQVPWEKFLAMLQSGEIAHSLIHACVAFYLLRRP